MIAPAEILRVSQASWRVPLTDDRELVASVLRRDRKATAEFVASHTDFIYAYVRRRFFPRADGVDDLVQDIFLAAWRQLPEYRGEASLRGWLLGIARHKVEDYYRARLRSPESWPEDVDSPVSGLHFDPPWDESLDQAALLARTRRTLALLSEPYRSALIGRYWEKRSTEEMARLAGNTAKSMERLLARAREQFKKRWLDE